MITKEAKYILLLVFMNFALWFGITFVYEAFPHFFGDWVCGGFVCDANGVHQECPHGVRHYAPMLHYGIRHWVCIWFCIFLTLVSFIKILDIANEVD